MFLTFFLSPGKVKPCPLVFLHYQFSNSSHIWQSLDSLQWSVIWQLLLELCCLYMEFSGSSVKDKLHAGLVDYWGKTTTSKDHCIWFEVSAGKSVIVFGFFLLVFCSHCTTWSASATASNSVWEIQWRPAEATLFYAVTKWLLILSQILNFLIV